MPATAWSASQGWVGEGDAAGQGQALALGIVDRRRRAAGARARLADRGWRRRPGAAGEPVALALEGVGGQRDPLAPPGEERRPVELGPGDVGGGEGAAEGVGLRRVPGAGSGSERVLRPPPLQALAAIALSTGVGAELEEGRGALLGEGGDRVGEAHRLAHLGDPVGGVGCLLGGRAARR